MTAVSPVHSARKLSAVLGTTSALSCDPGTLGEGGVVSKLEFRPSAEVAIYAHR